MFGLCGVAFATHQSDPTATDLDRLCRHNDGRIGVGRLVVARSRGAHAEHNPRHLRRPSMRHRDRAKADERHARNLWFCSIDHAALTLRGRIRDGVAYGISLGLGFVVIAAPWSYRLRAKFGNPLFPLMNQYIPLAGIHKLSRCTISVSFRQRVPRLCWRPVRR